MARDLDATLATEITQPEVRLRLFYEGEFEGGTVRLWTGVGDLSLFGQTWLGVGLLLGVSRVGETADLRAVGYTVSLAGLSSEVYAMVLANARLGKPGRVYVGCLSDAGAVVGVPYLAFEGRLDLPNIEMDGTSAVVTVNYESEMIALERARVRRLTHEDQQIGHPGNPSFEYVAGLQQTEATF